MKKKQNRSERQNAPSHNRHTLIESELQRRLFALQDLSYREFQSKLIPSLDPDLVIGVRTPQLRKFAKEYGKEPSAAEFLKQLPHTYYEENNLHVCLIEGEKDFSRALCMTEEFLPYIDNWATCDMLSPKVFRKHLDELFEHILLWIQSDRTYTVRFAIGMLMRHYLDDAYDAKYPELVASIRSEEYYINMMIAWYFATALTKQYDAILPYLEQTRLEPWTHNKTIQKATESYRITGEQKAYLRTLRCR